MTLIWPLLFVSGLCSNFLDAHYDRLAVAQCPNKVNIQFLLNSTRIGVFIVRIAQPARSSKMEGGFLK